MLVMIKSSFRGLTVAVLICISSIASTGHATACMIVGSADSTYWFETATSIVDATVYNIDRKPLIGNGYSGTNLKYADSWVLKLRVHSTIRGEPLGLREVATRISNTTIVDERYVQGLLGERMEFAILDVPYAKSPYILTSLLELALPPNIEGVHALDDKGKELGELWEGLCTGPPIFNLGTFKE